MAMSDLKDNKDVEASNEWTDLQKAISRFDQCASVISENIIFLEANSAYISNKDDADVALVALYKKRTAFINE